MKFLGLFILSVCLYSSTVPSVMAEGGHVGNGGDIRRFRVATARSQLVNLFRDFETNLKDSTCAQSAVNLDPILKLNAGLLSEWVLRLRADFGDRFGNADPTGPTRAQACVTTLKNSSSLEMIFSYKHCPIVLQSPTFYFDILGHEFLKAIMPSAQNSFDHRIEDIQKFNEACRPSPRPNFPVIPFATSSLATGAFGETEFNLGRAYALHTVSQYDFAALDNTPANQLSPVQQTIKRMKNQYIDELVHLVFSIDDTSLTCGLTGITPRSPVYFNPSLCVDVQNDREMGWLILHECAHHLNINVESFADAIAFEFLPGKN